MRKKSHISLAGFLVRDIQAKELLAHKKAFYIGSILPDCKPSFLTTKHEFDETFELVKERLTSLTQREYRLGKNPRVFIRQLGEVIHYIADYFTFPHNHTYTGNLKDHCFYEEKLKLGLREYIKSGRASKDKQEMLQFDSVETLIQYIGKCHMDYLSRKRNVEEDCLYIVRICNQVTQAVFHLTSMEHQNIALPQAV